MVAGLNNWRTGVIKTDFANQQTITGKILLNREVIEQIASRARAITDARIFDMNNLSWGWGRAYNYQYGKQVVNLIVQLCKEHPDPQVLARAEVARERAFEELQAMARQEQHEKLVTLFDECYEAVKSHTHIVTKGRGSKTRQDVVKRCHPFLQLPKRNVCLYSFV